MRKTSQSLATVPDARLRAANAHPVNDQGEFVLYWMTSQRRVRWNFALQHAVGWAQDMVRPLLVLEHLPCGLPWDSDRLHAFVLAGMRDNGARLRRRGVVYYPFAEREPGEGRGLLAALGRRACIVITDDFPGSAHGRLLAAGASVVPVRMEAVDGNGVLPLRTTDRVFLTAFAFRRFLQRVLPTHLAEVPVADPLFRAALPPAFALPEDIVQRWPPVSARLLRGTPKALALLRIDHRVPPTAVPGGAVAAEQALQRFVEERLDRYARERDQPDAEATSGLSPYLHHGHISAHRVFAAVAEHEDWTDDRLAARATGSRHGWWGMRESAEVFLDQLITWRELGYNLAWQRGDDGDYELLPAWARKTLETHASDPRPHLYTSEQLESAETHDPVWNAAQTQLVREGRIHNYLRMLWGKKILEWMPHPRRALETMLHLNNKYALDGRNPNSYSGIGWVLGLYDRPWGPLRPVFGSVRYMSSQNTVRKLRMREYLRRYGPS